MGYYHTDERGYVKDKYGNFKDSAEVAKAVRNGDLRYYNNGKYAYNPNTGEDYHADGTRR